MEMTNELAKVTPEQTSESPDMAGAVYEAIRAVVVLLSPFVPHIAEELWEQLGETPGMVRLSWPKSDPEMLVEQEVAIVVQVNGKKRGEVTVSADSSEDEVKQAALAQPNGRAANATTK